MSRSLLDAIGNTPVIEIKRLNPNPAVKILAKLEYFNPGGSVKDRPALAMIEAGEKSGELTPEKTVIEATSGNTGIGLALVCAVKGYKLLLTMSEAVSKERQKILRARGADILLTPGHLGTDGAIEEVYNLAREHPDSYFMADQFNNPANWQAHYNGTGEEIWRQTEGKITTLVATLGTSGTLMGISRRLKEYNPQIRIVGVEPYLGHKLQGLKNMKEAYRPLIFDKARLDQKINIEDEDAFEMTRRLAREEGLFVGMSSGAAMAVAARQAQSMTAGLIVVVFPDSGERYLSTPVFTVRKTIDLRLFNTLSRSKEPFEPAVPGKVSMYSCGPTADSDLHLGECRRFVFADLLSRYLEFRGYAVKHIINITDLDDNTINGSQTAGEKLSEFTARHIRNFERDLKRLHIKPADKYPRASEHVDDMVALADKLVNRGFAYEKLRSLYFNLSKLPEYGRLSGVDLEKIRLGATVDLDDYVKDNPRDFTLFKRAKLNELKRGLYAKTDWGSVRPSWHIQCAAMSMKYLGPHFDIHTSSRELMFPHHENEIAIALALTGKPLARYWVHCDQVLVAGKKAGENGRGQTVTELMDQGYTGRELRFWLMSTHYRKPLTYSQNRLENGKRSLKRLDTCIRNLVDLKNGNDTPTAAESADVDSIVDTDLDQLLYDIRHGFTNAMDDDLNVSGAMAAVFQNVRQVNRFIRTNRLNADTAAKILGAFGAVDQVLQLFDIEKKTIDGKTRELIKQREQARQEKNWALADDLRDRLLAQGVVIRDEKIGL